jgi:hypothetical protein
MTKDNDLIEWQFVNDYAGFALRMNFLAIVTFLEKARFLSDPVERKSICLSGLQLLYGSYEDFAILLQAFRNRISGRHLHLSIGAEDKSRKGSTVLPKIFKRFESVRQMLDNFGFTSLTPQELSQCLNIRGDRLEEHWLNIADSIRDLGDYQGRVNDQKNKLKHGKPVFQEAAPGMDPDHVVFFRWDESSGTPVLELRRLNASINQLEVATIQVAKIYLKSLDFLWLFMKHYHPEHVDEFLETATRCYSHCVDVVRDLGLGSNGLTQDGSQDTP